MIEMEFFEAGIMSQIPAPIEIQNKQGMEREGCQNARYN